MKSTHLHWSIFVIATVLAVLPAAGCTSTVPTNEMSGSPRVVTQDPAPDGFGHSYNAGAKGDTITEGGVTIHYPDNAFDGSAVISVGRDIGEVQNVFAVETYGQPVHIDHDKPLLQPVTVVWNVSQLTQEQQDSAIIVRWDDTLQVWSATDEVPVVQDGTLSVTTTGFSVLDWLSSGAAALGQMVGQWMGKRADAPVCDKNKDQTLSAMPSWVTNMIRPDQDQSAAPLRTCLEPDKDNVITVRVANNRPYGQMITLGEGADEYAWTWRGDEDYTVAGLLISAINDAMSSNSAMILSPVATGAVGISRPSEPGNDTIVIDGHSAWQTIMTDILSYILDNVSGLDTVQGFDSDLMNALAQAMYDCVGKTFLQTRDPGFSDVLGSVISCASNPDVLASLVSAGGKSVGSVQSSRLLKSAMKKLSGYVTIVDLADYSAELLSEAALGTTSITINVRGQQPDLGTWTPTCTDPTVDSNLLFKNLILRDEYATSSKELADFADWQSNAAIAVEPLANCPQTHIDAVERDVRTTWGDPEAAEVVADQIANLASQTDAGTSSGTVILSADGIGQFRFGESEDEVLPSLMSALGQPTISGIAGGCEGGGRVWNSYAQFGNLDVHFVGSDLTENSPRTLASWQWAASDPPAAPLALDSSIPFGLTIDELKATYPSGSGLSNMGAWCSDTGVCFIPPQVVGDSYLVHAGSLDWCS